MILHLIGNGPSIKHFPLDAEGTRIGCNFSDEKYNCAWTFIADIKPIKSIYEGQRLPCPAILSDRANEFIEKKAFKPDPRNIEIYKVVPFIKRKDIHKRWGMNSAQHAVWYGLEEFKPKEVHLWGCDSLWSSDITSATDKIVHKDLDFMNGTEVYYTWRDYWNYIIDINRHTKFIIHGYQKPDLKEEINMIWEKL